MKYTNKMNLPAFVEHALKADDYVGSKRENSISATTLIGPPHIRQLRKLHDDEIEVDVSTRMWSMLGQIGHSIVSRLEKFEDIDNYIIEKRFESEVEYTNQFGKRESIYIDGQPDVFYEPNGGILYDNKFTTHWSVTFGKDEWVEQMNIYAWLLRNHGYDVNKIQVVAWLRDLTAIDKLKHDKPDSDIVLVDIPVWPQDTVTQFIIERLRYHSVEATECSEKERWAKKPKYAVIKHNATKATKLYDSMEEAYKNVKDGYKVEYRPGSDPRCERYCELTRFCNYYKNKYGDKNGNN
jgi:hypothetical protein